MQMKLYCSKCGSTLKVESVADFSNPNEVELRVIVRPCSECASQQSVQADLALTCQACTEKPATVHYCNDCYFGNEPSG